MHCRTVEPLLHELYQPICHELPLNRFLTLRAAGLYCPPGDFYIDPMRPVARAVVTHAHSDHARAGHESVWATAQTLDIMALRLGKNFCQFRHSLAYGEQVAFGPVALSLHSAGHVLGSAQARLEIEGFSAVVSGDYKRRPDRSCAPFELVQCDLFVSEATFGLPVFQMPAPEQEIVKLLTSLTLFPERAHVIGVYGLGKAQSLTALLRQCGYRACLFVHPGFMPLMDYYRAQGIDLGDYVAVTAKDDLRGRIVLCPPGAWNGSWNGSGNGSWLARLDDPVTAMASGWMLSRARARRSGIGLPLILSDHADWSALQQTIIETNCRELWVTHGAEDALMYWARSIGLEAYKLRAFRQDEEDLCTLSPDCSTG